MNPNRTISLLLCIALLCMALTGCNAGKEAAPELNTTMYAAIISPEGKVSKEFEITVDAKILHKTDTPSSDESDAMTIEVSTPSDFAYLINKTEVENLEYDWNGFPYYVAHSFAYNRVTGFPDPVIFALDMENKSMIFNWSDSAEIYLVASADPEFDPNALLTHFSEFITRYGDSF